MPRHRRSPVPPFIAAMLTAIIAAGGVGFIVGTGQVDDTVFTARQQEFLIGLVSGTQIRSMAKSPDSSIDAERAICAGRFYPDRPAAMAGCVAGLTDPPRGGYRMPPP